MFTSEDFNTMYDSSDFPLVMTSSDRLYFGLSLDTELDVLELFALQCVATPTTDPTDEPNVRVIHEGCHLDPTITKDDARSSDTALYYSVDAFTIPNADDSRLVYFHCTMLVCLKDDPDSRCKQGCIPTSRRRRTLTGMHEIRALTDLGKTRAPTGLGKTRAPNDLGKTRAPTGLGKTRAPNDLGKTRAPTDLGKTRAPTDLGKTRAPNDLGKTQAPTDLGKTRAPTDLGKTRAPTDLGKTRPLTDLGKTRPVTDLGKIRVRRESITERRANISQGPIIIADGHGDYVFPTIGVAMGTVGAVLGVMLLVAALGRGRKKRDQDIKEMAAERCVVLDNSAFLSMEQMKRWGANPAYDPE
ncbi:uncharacterized protein LOC144886990 [Branchiostoma floridae x Branchiostoma japonicum]